MKLTLFETPDGCFQVDASQQQKGEHNSTLAMELPLKTADSPILLRATNLLDCRSWLTPGSWLIQKLAVHVSALQCVVAPTLQNCEVPTCKKTPRIAVFNTEQLAYFGVEFHNFLPIIGL